MPKLKYSTLEKSIRAIKFIHNHRYFTVADIRDELGIAHSNARNYVNELCRHFPIVEVKKHRRTKYSAGTMAALYKLEHTK